MKATEYKLATSDNQEIQVYEWLPDDDTKITGILQIVHGMAEHGKRYTHFAHFLNKQGFVVYASDHRGHGKTAGKVENLGFFGKKNGWDRVIADLKVLSSHIKDKYPELPFFILGHSMGSFLTRKYILKSPFKLNGAILSGTGGNPGILGRIGVFITRFLMLFYPKNSQSKLMDKLSFGSFNAKFKPNRTAFDWLSRNDEEVDKYIEDPYCGAIFSLKFFEDMITGLLFVSRQSNVNKTPEDLPIYIFSGSFDPVGNFGKGPTELYGKYKKAGVKDIKIRLYEGARHETLNEINRDEVYNNILQWILSQMV